jgi:hypothetical protein
MMSKRSVVPRTAMWTVDHDFCDPEVVQLESLVAGCRLQAKDGTPFIRTNRTCICFCNLRTGVLCSAREICCRNGGFDEQSVNQPLGDIDHDGAA